MIGKRRSLTTLLTVTFTALLFAFFVLACVFSAPPGMVHAADNEQTEASFAKLEFNGTTKFFDEDGKDPATDTTAVTLATVFAEANELASDKDNHVKITLLKDRVAKAVTTLEIQQNKYIDFDLAGNLLDFNHIDLAKGSSFSPITVQSGGTLTITDSNPTTPRNYSDEAANGIYTFGTGSKTLYGGVITGGFTEKASSSNGGGCICVIGQLIMDGGNIAGNKATHKGGGVYVNGGTFEIKKGNITGNVAGNDGGGVYVGGSGSLIVSGAAVNIDGNHQEKVDNKGKVTINDNNAHTNKIKITVGASLVDDENIASIRLTESSKGVSFIGFDSYDQRGKKLSDFFYFDNYAEGNDNCVSGGSAHNPGSDWLQDSDGHWKECTACGAKVNAAVHNTNGNGGSCSECGFSATFEVTVVAGGNTGTSRYEDVTEAWAAATAEGVESATIKMFVDATVQNGTLTMTEGNVVTLDLNGHTLEGTGRGSVITVDNGGAFTLNDGDNTANNGKITGGTGYEAIENHFYGGGVYVYCGSFTMNGGTITGNNAGNNGGGVYIDNGTFILNNGKITDNSAIREGGGVFVTDTNSICTINGGSISYNSANQTGGLSFEGGTLTISGGSIIGNKTTEYDRCGVYFEGEKLILSGSVNISGNTLNDGTDCNLYFLGLFVQSGVIEVGKMTDGAKIGFNFDEQNITIGVISAGYGENNKDGSGNVISPDNYFFVDNAGYCAGLTDGGELNIGEHKAVEVWSHDESKHYHECVNKCGERFNEADHGITSLVVSHPTKTSYTAFDEFDKSSITVKTHCEVCESDVAEISGNEYSVNYGNDDGKNYLHAGDSKSVTIEYQTSAGKLEGSVSGLTVSKKNAEVTWEYAADGIAWGAWKNEFTFDPDRGLRNSVRAKFENAQNDTEENVYQGSNSRMTVLKGSGELSSSDAIRNAGTYTLSLNENYFPDYSFTNNSATVTITPLKLEVNNEANFYWLLDGYNSQLRTGYIYYNESDPDDINNFKYFSTAGENRTRVIRSIVRYRDGESLTVKLFGARSSDNAGSQGVYDITYNSGNVGTGLNKYTANATLTLKEAEKDNYEFILTGTLAAERHMTATISADGNTVTVTKEWYIAVIDNGLRSQYTDENGNTYGTEWKMYGWTYGDYKPQYAPRLEHGDPGAHNSVIDFTQTDNELVSFVLYRIVTDGNGTRNVRIGERFSRSEFASYINASVPAGSYILHVFVEQAVSSPTHEHWYDGQQHDSASASEYDAFDREFDFVVEKATFTGKTNADALGGKSFTYTYDGALHLFDNTFTLTVPQDVTRAGIWLNEEYNEYYGAAELRYHLTRWGGSNFVTAETLESQANPTQTPKNADTYRVYFKLVALNYEDFGGSEFFTVQINKIIIEKPADKTVTYNGSAQVYEAAANAPYSVTGIASYTNANEAGYNISLALNDADNYGWKDESGATVTVKLIINRAVVEKPVDQTVTYNGSAHAYGVAANAQYTVKNAVSYTNAGNYDVTVTLKDAENYAWKNADGSLSAEDLTVRLNINKAQISVPENVTIMLDGEYVYAIPSGAPYEIVGNAAFAEAGEYDITLRLKDSANYEWKRADGNVLQDNTVNIKLNLTSEPANANPVWLYLTIAMGAVVAVEVIYLICRGLRKNKNTEAKE